MKDKYKIDYFFLLVSIIKLITLTVIKYKFFSMYQNNYNSIVTKVYFYLL